MLKYLISSFELSESKFHIAHLREKCLQISAPKTSIIRQSLMKMRNLFGLSQASERGVKMRVLLLQTSPIPSPENILLVFSSSKPLTASGESNNLFYFKTFTHRVTCSQMVYFLSAHLLLIVWPFGTNVKNSVISSASRRETCFVARLH